jgi:hypothetical protein
VKVAVSAAGPKMEAAVDPRFGRCPWFVVVERFAAGRHQAAAAPNAASHADLSDRGRCRGSVRDAAAGRGVTPPDAWVHHHG